MTNPFRQEISIVKQTSLNPGFRISDLGPFSLFLALVLILAIPPNKTVFSQDFEWPEGKKMAISLSFDDARESQITGGADLLTHHGVKGTFYVLPEAVEKNLAGWLKVVADGHEIGNHSLVHPCTGNFSWTDGKELENYNIEKMRAELVAANEQIEKLLGVKPVSYAYPCGETFVGRGQETKSMVPLIDQLFTSGRDWRNEMTNDPQFVDLAQVRGTEMDGMDFVEIEELLETAIKEGSWVALAGHEIDEGGNQTVRVDFLLELFIFVKQNPEVWLATDGEIAAYIKSTREN